MKLKFIKQDGDYFTPEEHQQYVACLRAEDWVGMSRVLATVSRMRPMRRRPARRELWASHREGL